MSTPAAPTPAAPAPSSEPNPAPKYKEVPFKQLDPRVQRQIEQADKTADRNPGVAIEICNGILNTNPAIVEARKILRKAQKKANPAAGKGMTKLLSGLTNTPFVLKAGSQIKTDPKGVIDAAEKLLAVNPNNVQALRLEAQAAAAMGLWGTCALAYENIRDLEPDNVDNLIALGNAFIEAGQPKEAIKQGEHVLEMNPGNGDAQALLRRASVAITMDKGKWEEQTDFRQKLADSKQAQDLESAARMSTDADSLNALVVKLADAIAAQPENINLYRDILGALKSLQRWDDALVWVRKAREQPLGKADTTLEKLENDLTVSRMTAKLEELEAAVATNPARQPELDALRREQLDFRVQQAKALVEKYPNDFGFRFDYGVLLYETNQTDLAIRELQQARRNPKVAHRAMLYLGRSYRAKGIYDLAIEVLAQARDEIPIMNDLKKEITYELALCYRKNGNVEKAVAEYKSIYSNDIDYKDVAQIINEYYEKKTLS